MKGVIVACLKELVEGEFGEDRWQAILERSGMEKGSTFLPIDDVDHERVMAMVQATCEVLGISLQQAADAFGKHWVCDYAPKIYGAYYGNSRTGREFLMQLDDIHVATTRMIKNAHPPRFTYEYVDESTILMEYHSERGLMPFFTGLVKGVAEYFGETANVSSAGTNKLRIELREA